MIDVFKTGDQIFKVVLSSLQFASKVLDSDLLKEREKVSESSPPIDSETRDSSGARDRDAILRALHKTAAENSEYIESVIHQAVRDVKAEIRQSTAVIIDKIEHEKHEMLFSRVNSVGTVLRIGVTRECLPMVLELNELTEYAQHRMNEGKLHWAAACIIGKSTYIAAIERLAEDTNLQLRQELTAICNHAKSQILDILVPQIFAKGGKISWGGIHTFLSSSVDVPMTLDFLQVDVSTPVLFKNNIASIELGKNHEIRPKGDFNNGRVVRWRKRVGDVVSPGDILVGINIDGRLENIYSEVHGTLRRIVLADGQTFQSQQPTLLGLISG